MAGDVVDVTIVARVPFIEGFVQAVEPICRRWEVCDLLAGDGVRYEDGNRVANEHVARLDVAPQEIPDVGLGRARLGNEVASDLDMRSIENWAAWCRFLDEWNEAGHLRVINLAWLVHAWYNWGEYGLTMTTSAPPSSGARSGPPSENQYRAAFS